MNVTIAAVTAPSHLNGVSRHAVNLARALLQVHAVRRVHFLIGDWQKEMLQESNQTWDPRLQIHVLSPNNTSLGLVTWYYRDLPFVAEQLQSDVVHLAYPAPARAARFRCPLIVTLHDLYPFEIPSNWGPVKSWLARQSLRHALQSADAIACVSESTRLALERFLPGHASRASTISNSVPPLGCSSSRRPGAIPAATPFVLCVAQHRANKNIPFGVRVFQRCLRRGILPHHALLAIVGIDGPETAAIRRLIRELDLQSNVLVMSGLHDTELKWCYKNCVALLAPSITEGFGLPVAEAMLTGCPVVCSDIPAFREIAGDTCHLVAFGDGAIDAYCRALRDVQLDPRPRPVAMPQLSLSSIGNQCIELYQEILSRRNARFAILGQPTLDHDKKQSPSTRSPVRR